jgi:hypothetical protein
MASPGRGATPGRPGSPLRGPGEAEAAVVGGGARRTTDGCPAGTGRSCGIDSGAAGVAGVRRAGASGAGASGARGAAWAGAGRVDAPVTGRSRTTGGAAAGFRGSGFGVRGGGGVARVSVGAEAAGGLSLGFRTLRTRSAIGSGTTLNWFFASKTPPKRSLKSVVSSFEVSPTSLASSNILTFPAKFTLEREALESHQLECAEPQPTAWLR